MCTLFFEAKKLFIKYNGSYFQMDRDGVYTTYEKFNVPKEIEAKWKNELLGNVMERLQKETKKDKINDNLIQYCSMCSNWRIFEAFEALAFYIINNIKVLDSFTLYIGVDGIFDILKEFKKMNTHQNECFSIAEKVFYAFRDSIKDNISVSDDYAVAGRIPDFLSYEKLQHRFYTSIKEWELVLHNNTCNKE